MQIGFAVAVGGIEPAKAGRLFRVTQFADIHPIAAEFLRGNHQQTGPVHGKQFAGNLVEGAYNAGLHSRLSQGTGDHRLFRAQLLLLLGEITEQEAQHQQIDGAHEEAFGLERSGIDAQRRQAGSGRRGR